MVFNSAGAFDPEPEGHHVQGMHRFMHSMPPAYGEDTQCNGVVCGLIGCERTIERCERLTLKQRT